MKIVTEGYLKEDDDILLDEVSMIYYQEPDCTEDMDGNGQTLKITTRDGGAGKFLNIKTGSWSISGIEDLKLIIDDFNRRIRNENINNT